MNPGADELNQSPKQLEEGLTGANPCDTAASCAVCSGMVHHEPWCVAVNKEIEYAFLLAANPATITEGDQIALHSLGVLWHSYTENYT
jgi:hypothetical protein